jgi:hypothetical protein
MDVKRDSINVHTSVVERDSTIVFPQEEVTLQAPLIVTGGVVADIPLRRETSGRATVTLEVKGGQLNAKGECAALEAKVKSLEKTLHHYQSSSDTSRKEIRVPVPYVPKGVKYLAWWGGISLVILIAGACYLVGTIKTKLF